VQEKLNQSAFATLRQIALISCKVHYNLSFREPEKVGLLNHAIDKDYFVVAWRPLRLKRRNQNNPAVSYNIWEKGVSPIVDEMANKYNLSNTQIALLWTTAHSHVTTLIKSSSPAHLKEAVDSFKTFIPSDDIAKLSQDFVPQYDISDTIALI
jgi:diketogulonate reductase-like aldo/keto reductase